MERETLPEGAVGTQGTAPHDQPSAVPPRALEIWKARPDLQAAFDLSTATGADGLFWWYYLHAFREIGLSLLDSDDADFLNEPQPGLPQRGWTPVTRLMFEMDRRRRMARRAQRGGTSGHWRRRLLLRLETVAHPLSLPGAQTKLAAWFFTRGLSESNLLGLLDTTQAWALLAPARGCPSMPRIVQLIWEADSELRRMFPDRRDPAVLRWCEQHGRRRWPILAHPAIRIAAPRSASARGPSALPLGVNLFGHARARLGVGEDVRMAAKSLESAGVPYVIHDVAAGSIAPEEFGLESRIRDAMPYRFNLFCMTGMETITTILARGRGEFDEHINIGFWPWELPEWPAFWHHAYDFVDEVWASTTFTAEAFRRSSPVAVSQMPMAVSVDESEGLDRTDFGLPASRFLFTYAFDGLSSFHRKNPTACVLAFHQAFPDPNLPVGLVLKGLRVEDCDEWRALEAMALADPRIHLLSGSYSRGALLDLYRNTDCFISLHRSEGFGRNIAEAMMLGKPVIATAFSGNLDFTRPDTAFLVNFTSRELGPRDYPFGEGQHWAEPDIGHAADQMRSVVGNDLLRNAVAKSGQNYVNSVYAPPIVGKTYKAELTHRYRRCIP